MYNDHIDYKNEISTENMVQYDRFLGAEIDLQEASEPSDIIWENRAFSEKTRNIKRLISAVIILIMLAGSASIIYFCSIKSLQLKTKYPNLDCLN